MELTRSARRERELSRRVGGERARCLIPEGVVTHPGQRRSTITSGNAGLTIVRLAVTIVEEPLTVVEESLTVVELALTVVSLPVMLQF